jgi:hypothetical protein
MQNTTGRKKFDLSFPRQVALSFIVVSGVASYPLFVYASAEVAKACIAGAVTSLANVIAGYAAIEYSIDKSYTVFLRAVLGGTGVRMVAMLGIIMVLIKFFRFHAVALVVSLMVFYSLFLILELMFIQKKMTKKAEG